MTADILTRRALNRATLERQLLLRHSDMSVLDAVEHLVGMQAQIPLNPYLGLFSRLEGFRPGALTQLLIDRAVVRTVVMRGTIHLVSADDCLMLRPLMQPVLDQELARHPQYGPTLLGLDLEPILEFGRDVLSERPMNGKELRSAMAKRFPKRDAAACAYACRCLLPLVQVPPRGVWRRSGEVRTTTAEAWIGRSLANKPSIDDVVLRYLAAFGPASTADVASWSRLTGMREVLDRLNRKLRRFNDENGRELWDVPDAPRPHADTPAPTRFLPEYDNVVLSHADRSRFSSEKHRDRPFATDKPIHGSVLVDGFLCGTWRIEKDRERGAAVLTVDHMERLTKRASASIAAEGRRMLRFNVPDATDHEVRFSPLD
ncbi:MAG TPA: winged helix DNA-binding domain-containing protein [Actinomycetota bacterium]|nr:winged helix DNA-binding domain-containing protein [Actinomycetota bacterium]